MPPDALLDPESDLGFRILLNACVAECQLTELESHARRVFEQQRCRGAYPRVHAKAERARVLAKLKASGGLIEGWEKIFGGRVETAAPVTPEMDRRREEDVYIFSDASRHHRLKIVGILFGKIIITLNARVGRQRKGRAARFVEQVITRADLYGPAQALLADRRAVDRSVEPVGDPVSEPERRDRKTV